MKCGMCGYEFEPEEAERSCGGCPLVKGCGLVRCPRCGYEMPPEAVLVRWIRKIRNIHREDTKGAKNYELKRTGRS